MEATRRQSEEAITKVQSLHANLLSLEAEAVTRQSEEHKAHEKYLEASRNDPNAQSAVDLEQTADVVLEQIADAKQQMQHFAVKLKEIKEVRSSLAAAEEAAALADRQLKEATAELVRTERVAVEAEGALASAEKVLKAAEKSKKKATEAWRDAVR